VETASLEQVPEIRHVDVGGLLIAFQVFGAGPNVVVSPAMLAHLEVALDSPEQLARMYRALAKQWRVVVFDRRGIGLSDRTAEPAGVTEHAADLGAVMDAAGMESAVVVAEADAVPAAAVFCAKHPERVTMFAAFSASARVLPDQDYPWGLSWEAHEHILDEQMPRWGNRRNPAWLEILAPSRADNLVWRGFVARAQRLACTPRAARAYVGENILLDVRHVLHDIQAPTLVGHASGDLVYPIEQARWFAEHIPDARLVTWKHTDHMSLGLFTAEVLEFITGSRPKELSDTRLATVLFTDIVDSTRRASDLGDDAWGLLLDAHDAAVRRELDRYDGREIAKTGDGFLAPFEAPTAAIEAACDIRDDVRALGIEIRAGLHTGLVVVRGSEVAGTALNIASRVQSCAAPSEVLVSRTVADLLAGSDLALAERGSHALKGLPDDWQLYAVT
jgi:class 3 adenylate cyclase